MAHRSGLLVTTRSLLSDNLFTGLHSSIVEHRWNDVLELLPCLIPLDVDRSYLWRIIHLLMIHCEEFTLEHQIQFLKLFFLVKGHSAKIALEWFMQKMPIYDNQLNNFMHQVRRYAIPINSYKLSLFSMYFDSYLALNSYMIWQKAKAEKPGDDDCEKERIENIISLGLRAYDALQSAFHSHMNKKDSLGPVLDGLVWVIGPLLHVENETRILLKKSDDNKLTSKWGLEFVKHYMPQQWDNLPPLRLVVKYLHEVHPEELSLIKIVLKRICELNPEDPLVLEYVKCMKKGKFQPTSSSEGSRNVEEAQTDRGAAKCSLEDHDMDDLMKCINLLTHLLEFPSWKDDIAPWKLLSKILKTFHMAWLYCWNCKKCVHGRSEMKKMNRNLVLWPKLFWDAKLPLRSKNEAKKAYHIAYSSFIFGYKPQTFFIISKKLKDSYPKIRQDLCDDVTAQGPHRNEFLAYIESIYKECFDPKNQGSTSQPKEGELVVLHDGSKPSSSFFRKKESYTKGVS